MNCIERYTSVKPVYIIICIYYRFKSDFHYRKVLLSVISNLTDQVFGSAGSNVTWNQIPMSTRLNHVDLKCKVKSLKTCSTLLMHREGELQKKERRARIAVLRHEYIAI
ncbi:uncharacterized protein LOC143143973 [Ptiloglossa arizonensis]|uniref:uncharacterized protein LOC143143973 n=1 Tax=Ptiloglossa arizonensis TaxID=3350558 RepID=UPI003FA121A7